jgi:hypothetical protein
MNQSSDPQAGQAYTRASVEAYLRAAATERLRLLSGIAEAQARTAEARRREEQLHASGMDTAAVPVDGYDGRRPAVVENPDSLARRLPFGLNGQSSHCHGQDLPTAAARD